MGRRFTRREILARLRRTTAEGKPIIAAGGVSTIEHLERLVEVGAEGAIIGRALYTGDLDLREALERIG